MTAHTAACRRVQAGNTPVDDGHPDVAATLANWDAGRRRAAQLLGPNPQFVHFTSPGDAAAIAVTGELHLSATIVDAVYAVAVGGADVPGVQQGAGGGFGAVDGPRTAAVVFRADELPDTLFPEEVIWHRATPLAVRDVTVTSCDIARRLLDGSAHIDD